MFKLQSLKNNIGRLLQSWGRYLSDRDDTTQGAESLVQPEFSRCPSDPPKHWLEMVKNNAPRYYEELGLRGHRSVKPAQAPDEHPPHGRSNLNDAGLNGDAGYRTTPSSMRSESTVERSSIPPLETVRSENALINEKHSYGHKHDSSYEERLLKHSQIPRHFAPDDHDEFSKSGISEDDVSRNDALKNDSAISKSRETECKAQRNHNEDAREVSEPGNDLSDHLLIDRKSRFETPAFTSKVKSVFFRTKHADTEPLTSDVQLKNTVNGQSNSELDGDPSTKSSIENCPDQFFSSTAIHDSKHICNSKTFKFLTETDSDKASYTHRQTGCSTPSMSDFEKSCYMTDAESLQKQVLQNTDMSSPVFSEGKQSQLTENPGAAKNEGTSVEKNSLYREKSSKLGSNTITRFTDEVCGASEEIGCDYRRSMSMYGSITMSCVKAMSCEKNTNENQEMENCSIDTLFLSSNGRELNHFSNTDLKKGSFIKDNLFPEFVESQSDTRSDDKNLSRLDIETPAPKDSDWPELLDEAVLQESIPASRDQSCIDSILQRRCAREQKGTLWSV